MPAFLDRTPRTNKPLLDSILQNFGPDMVTTSIMGPLLMPSTQKLAKTFEKKVPDAVRTFAKDKLAKRLHRMIDDDVPNMPLQTRIDAIERATNDPIANLLVQGDISGTMPLNVSGKGQYGSIFTDDSAPALFEMLGEAAQGKSPRKATDLIQDILRDIRTRRYTSPEAVRLDTTSNRVPERLRDIYKQTVPHEMTHASQDRFGVFTSPIGQSGSKWGARPIEWEAIYAGHVGDPKASRLRIPDVLSRGQRMVADNYAKNLQPSDDEIQRAIVSLNNRLVQRNEGMLDMIRGGAETPTRSRVVEELDEMKDPTVRLLAQLMKNHK